MEKILSVLNGIARVLTDCTVCGCSHEILKPLDDVGLDPLDVPGYYGKLCADCINGILEEVADLPDFEEINDLLEDAREPEGPIYSDAFDDIDHVFEEIGLEEPDEFITDDEFLRRIEDWDNYG